MNYFEFYPGDYRRDTGRLSLAEHGAYLLLMTDYYGNEEPLPAALELLYRITGAQGATEQKAVRAVAEAFFPVGDDGLRHNARADAEIVKAQKRIKTAKENGAKGGRKKNPAGNPAGSQTGTQRDTQQGTQRTTRSGEALHVPHEKTESPIGDLSGLENPDSAPPARKPCPHDRIIAAYHEILPELRQVREWNETRTRLLARRWTESPERQSLDWWREFFGYVRKSRFLMGHTTGRDGRPFDCDLEWLIRPTNFAKVVEGKYEDAP